MGGCRSAAATEKDGAFHDYTAAATLRNLYVKKLTIPCIDAICDVADGAKAAEAEAPAVGPTPQIFRVARNMTAPACPVIKAAAAEAAAEAPAVGATPQIFRVCRNMTMPEC